VGGELGLEPPFVAKCDVIISYIYTKATQFVIYLSYVRLRSTYTERDRGFAVFAKEWSK